MAILSACSGTGPTDPDWLAAREVFGTCATCHGTAGEGGVGPALATVRETFPECDTHKQWISLGSELWKEQVGDTYGATSKPVAGRMPAFDQLSEEELAQIAVYERVRFGEADLETERQACGLD